MISRINPIYLILCSLIFTILLLFYTNEKKDELTISNQSVKTFQKNFNEYIFYSKFNFSRNQVIDNVKSIIEEFPNNLNINVKTLQTYIEVKIKAKPEQILTFLNMFYKSNLVFNQISMSENEVLIKVKI